MSNTNVTTDIDILEVQLTEIEIQQYSRELSGHIQDKEEAEDRLKSFSSQIKAEIKEHDVKIRELANKVRSGREFREVKIKITYDWLKGEKSYAREDTGEIYKVIPIAPHERQEDLFPNS